MNREDAGKTDCTTGHSPGVNLGYPDLSAPPNLHSLHSLLGGRQTWPSNPTVRARIRLEGLEDGVPNSQVHQFQSTSMGIPRSEFTHLEVSPLGPWLPLWAGTRTRTDRGHLFWKVTEPAPGTLKMVKIHANLGLSLKCLASGSSQTDGRDTYSTLRVPF